MKYIGIPTCPYCKKGVNIVRVWSLKKHGEYMCPRCKGISNIYLSPLVYLFAFLAVATGFLIYFFARFILDDLTPMTTAYVFAPFAVFFIITLFMVYLKKPDIKKIRKTSDGRYFDSMGKEYVMRIGKLVPLRTTGGKKPSLGTNPVNVKKTQEQAMPNNPVSKIEDEMFNNISSAVANSDIKKPANNQTTNTQSAVFEDLFTTEDNK